MRKHGTSDNPLPPAAPAATKTAPAPAAKPVEEPKVRPMEAARFRGSEYLRATYVCTAFPHTTPQDLLKADYWAHMSSQMRPRDRIEAWADDGTWMAEYVVLEAGRNWAKVFPLTVYHLTTADQAMTQADATSPYEITYRGIHAKWSVVRKADREVMSDGHETMAGATDWVIQRMKADKK